MTTIEMMNACKQLQAKLGNDRATVNCKISICGTGKIEIAIEAYHHIAGWSRECETITEAVENCISKAPASITTIIAEKESEIKELKAKQTLLLSAQ